MPRQSGNSVRGRTGFSKSWGLRASVSFSPFPSPVTHFFALAPIFAWLKNEKCLERAENLTETLATQAIYSATAKLSQLSTKLCETAYVTSYLGSDLELSESIECESLTSEVESETELGIEKELANQNQKILT